MVHQAPGLWSGSPLKVGVATGDMQLSPTIKVLHRAKWLSFFVGGSQNTGLWIRVPPSGGSGDLASVVRSLKTQPRFSVRL